MNYVRSLLLVALFVGISVLAIATSNGYSQPHAVTDLQSLLTFATNLAQTTGDGATITFAPGANNSTAVALWAHRPVPGSAAMESQPRKLFTTDVTISIAGATSSPAILFSSSGAASVTQWSPGGGTLSVDGSCSGGSLQITFTKESVSQVHSLPCSAPDEMQ